MTMFYCNINYYSILFDECSHIGRIEIVIFNVKISSWCRFRFKFIRKEIDFANSIKGMQCNLIIKIHYLFNHYFLYRSVCSYINYKYTAPSIYTSVFCTIIINDVIKYDDLRQYYDFRQQLGS